MPRQPFYSKGYEKRNERQDPVARIRIVTNNKLVEAYVDTGCTAGLAITKRRMRKLGLDLGEKINSEPVPSVLADGTLVATDYYLVEVELENEKKEVRIAVLDPETKLGIAKEELNEEPMLGRGFLDHFDVIFSGIDKKLTFLK